MVVEPSLPPARIQPFPPKRQPLAAEIASQRDAPSAGVVVVAARAVVAVKVVAVAVEAQDARTVILRLVARTPKSASTRDGAPRKAALSSTPRSQVPLMLPLPSKTMPLMLAMTGALPPPIPGVLLLLMARRPPRMVRTSQSAAKGRRKRRTTL